mgnify:CR=1 FL=1
MTLPDAVRDLVRASPRNLAARSRLADELKKQRQLLSAARERQTRQLGARLAPDHIPDDVPLALQDLASQATQILRLKRDRLRRVLELIPKFSQLKDSFDSSALFHRSYGRLLDIAGDPSCRQHYKRAIELDANDLPARDALAWHLLQSGNPGEALPIYEDLAERGCLTDDALKVHYGHHVLTGLLRCLRDLDRFDDLLERVRSLTDDELRAASAPFVVSALRQSGSQFQNTANLIDAVKVVLATSRAQGVSRALAIDAVKLVKDVLFRAERFGLDVELRDALRRLHEEAFDSISRVMRPEERDRFEVRELRGILGQP